MSDKLVHLYNDKTLKKGKMPTKWKTHDNGRTRNYLKPDEIEKLMKTASKLGRHGYRDKTLILFTYRHGLRASEVCDLRWVDVDIKKATVHVRRLKGSTDSTHWLKGDELRALRKIQRDYPDSPFVFSTERKGPMTPSGIRKMLVRAGNEAELPFQINTHMLRHSCGYALVNKGKDTRSLQGYLGHKNISNTEIYTALAEDRFRHFWDG